MTTSRQKSLRTHPSFGLILADLQAGNETPVAIAKRYDINGGTLKSWWHINRDSYVTASAPALDEEQATVLVEKLADSEARLLEMTNKFSDVAALFESLNIMNDYKPNVPEWFALKSAEDKHGTVCAVLSDLHLDEVVRKEEISGVNAYNRRIAELRLRRFFDKAVELPRDYLNGITYDGFVLMCLGDTFTGEIHDELAATNEGHPFETALYFLDHFVAGIRMLADHYGKVHVVSVPGNHDRTYKKPRYKGRVVTSLHYLFMKFVEREFQNDDRVTFQAPESPDATVKIYDTSYLCTHGDRFKGGNGVGGIVMPLLRGHHKTQLRQQAIRQPYDVMVMGHWHQYIAMPSSGLIINGSLKGFDEYSYGMGFNYEPAQQALWVTTPEHGATGFHLPIIVQDKKSERW